MLQGCCCGSRLFLSAFHCDKMIQDSSQLWMPLLNTTKITKVSLSIPICSMYGIFTYIWVIFRAHVGKYSIHGSYGIVACLTNMSCFNNTYVWTQVSRKRHCLLDVTPSSCGWNHWPNLHVPCFPGFPSTIPKIMAKLQNKNPQLTAFPWFIHHFPPQMADSPKPKPEPLPLPALRNGRGAPRRRLRLLRRHGLHGLAILLTAVETLDAKRRGLFFLQQLLDGAMIMY